LLLAYTTYYSLLPSDHSFQPQTQEIRRLSPLSGFKASLTLAKIITTEQKANPAEEKGLPKSKSQTAPARYNRG
jgi:hypothetical protein